MIKTTKRNVRSKKIKRQKIGKNVCNVIYKEFLKTNKKIKKKWAKDTGRNGNRASFTIKGQAEATLGNIFYCSYWQKSQSLMKYFVVNLPKQCLS